MVQRTVVKVVNLGLTRYSEALRVQQNYASSLLCAVRGQGNKQNSLLLLEHHPVYTVGLRTKEYTEQDESRLKGLGADFVKTNRGGLITFHGPGQQVMYPVLYLKDFKLGMRDYIHNLEQLVINMCKKWQLLANRSPCTGVWVGDKKLAAIGVHGSRYVTTHGVGINCNTDLTWFEHIVPCGIKDKGVTSLSQELGREVTVSDARQSLLTSFSEVFNCDLQTE